MKYIISILFFVLIGCANNEEYSSTSLSSKDSTSSVITPYGSKFSSPQTASRESAETWKTECHVNEDNSSYYFSFSYVNTDVSVKIEKYSDTDCVTNFSVQDEDHTYSIDFDSKNYKITMGSIIKLTPQSDLSVNLYNKGFRCNYNDWKLNVTKECAINEVENQNTGDVLYCSWYFEDGSTYSSNQSILYTTCDKESYPTNLFQFTKFTRQ